MRYTRPTRHAGFTIIELLVVVSIIGLLLALLVPAIGKARDSALQTQSLSNLRNLGAACQNYAAAWSDRQLTLMYDDFAQHISAPGRQFVKHQLCSSVAGKGGQATDTSGRLHHQVRCIDA
jgi:prepilin-type N-terminal cleavage/methylation domain-containing protein